MPELGEANPDGFGICIATVDRQVYEVGDSHQLFTVQSTSKAFAYGLALEDRGEEEYAGRELGLDHKVNESEKRTGHRNRAIGHMLRSFEILGDDPEPPLDLYFRQCSIQVDPRDLSVMAAALANGGTNDGRVRHPTRVREECLERHDDLRHVRLRR